MSSHAPILLFTYNRLFETKKTLEALQDNIGALDSDLTIFSDSAKDTDSIESVTLVREYLKAVTGFKSVTIIERPENFGLAKSIITGVSEVIKKYNRVIVVEDDLLTSKNFLSYMNQALGFYENNPSVWSISGFSFPITFSDDYNNDIAFGVRASSWGWATWVGQWEKVDWDVLDYDDFILDKNAQRKFKEGGSDLCKMLSDQVQGKINSWAIRFCYAQFRHKSVDVYPRVSKVQNIGFSEGASHTKGMGSRFTTIIDNSDTTDFTFSSNISVDSSILAQFRKPFSIITRLKYKLLAYLK
jgi:hypothetical protein